MISKEQIIYCSKIDKDLVLDYIEEDLMIYDEINGNVHVLNNTAKIIWDFISNKTYVYKIIEELKQIFEIDDLSMLENDIQEILNDLEDRELIICYRKDDD